MSQQATLSTFESSVMIHKYRETIAYGESEEGCKFLARWVVKVCPASAKIKIIFIKVL